MATKDKQKPEKPEDFRGLQKAAAFMLALPKDQASLIFDQMDDEEIRLLSQAMAGLGYISSENMENILVEFTSSITSTASLAGNLETTERLLRDILPSDKVENILEEIRGPAGRTIWEKLSNVNEDVLANYLKNEYPQTVAVVFSKIPPAHAAKVMSLFPPTFAQDVLIRMLRMESVRREILDDVEGTLRREFMSNLARTSKRDPHSMVADIFNHLDRGEDERFLELVGQINQDAADKIRSSMFTFDDLDKIPDQGIQLILRSADKDRLTYALKGASEKVKNLFLRNMAERAAKILRDDMENLGGVRLKQVTEAQADIIKITKDLINREEIVLNSGNAEDQIIY